VSQNIHFKPNPSKYFINRFLFLRLIVFLEADAVGVLSEATPAQVQIVLADQAVHVAANAALPDAAMLSLRLQFLNQQTT